MQEQQEQIYGCASHWTSSRVRASPHDSFFHSLRNTINSHLIHSTSHLYHHNTTIWYQSTWLCLNLDWEHNDFLYVHIGMWYFIFITSNKIKILIPNVLFLPPFSQTSSRFLWWIWTISLAFLICGCSIPSRRVLYTKSTWRLTY